MFFEGASRKTCNYTFENGKLESFLIFHFTHLLVTLGNLCSRLKATSPMTVAKALFALIIDEQEFD